MFNAINKHTPSRTPNKKERHFKTELFVVQQSVEEDGTGQYFYLVHLRDVLRRNYKSVTEPASSWAAGLCYLPSGVPPPCHIIRSANSRAPSGPKLWFTLLFARRDVSLSQWPLALASPSETGAERWTYIVGTRSWLADSARDNVSDLSRVEKSFENSSEQLIYGRQLTLVGHQVQENTSKGHLKPESLPI